MGFQLVTNKRKTLYKHGKERTLHIASPNLKLCLADVAMTFRPPPRACHPRPEGNVLTIGLAPKGSIDSRIRVRTRLWQESVVALNITKSKVDGVTVIHLSGAILFGGESKSLFIHAKDMLNKTPQIVLDLREATRIDSGGLGALVALSCRPEGSTVTSSLPTSATTQKRCCRLQG